MADRIVGIREAARRLDLNPKTLQNMCRDGRSPVKCAKRHDGPKAEWLFSDADLSRYVATLFGDADATAPIGEAADR
jgi:hypothetical protein